MAPSVYIRPRLEMVQRQQNHGTHSNLFPEIVYLESHSISDGK